MKKPRKPRQPQKCGAQQKKELCCHCIMFKDQTVRDGIIFGICKKYDTDIYFPKRSSILPKSDDDKLNGGWGKQSNKW